MNHGRGTGPCRAPAARCRSNARKARNSSRAWNRADRRHDARAAQHRADLRRHGNGLGYSLGEFRHGPAILVRSEEHTSELQSLMRHSYAVFCLKKKNQLASTSESIYEI